MTNAFRVLADLFDLATMGACALAAYLLGTTILSGAASANAGDTGAGMGIVIGVLASGGLSIALIVPFYAVSGVFHRLWQRSAASDSHAGNALNEGAF